MWHSPLKITGAEYCMIMFSNTGAHTPIHFTTNYIHRPDVLNIAIIRTSAVPICTESVDHNPVILVMDLERQETTLWTCLESTAYYRLFLKHPIPRNPNMTSVKKIDAEITIFTITIRSAKKRLRSLSSIPASRLGYSTSLGIIAKKKTSKEKLAQL
jgi:hypothetical protein